ncbi:MAG: S-layer homology domain-containing protein, partial [Clostridia bacterium]|nr:S-layer homology domain-containing protein [Clostridia bacterium]
ASSDATIPYDFVKQLVSLRNIKTNRQHYMGQTMHAGKLVTYKMSFLNCAPVLEVIAEELPSTGEGEFKGESDTFTPHDDVADKVSEYLDGYTKEYLPKATMTTEEVRRYGKGKTINRIFERYSIFSELSDDTSIFSASQREKIKKNVASGKFLSFDKISILNDNTIFIEYYVNNSKNEEYAFDYDKKYSLVSENFTVINTYDSERDLDAEYLWSLVSAAAKPSDIRPDYEKTAEFRGIDDYVKYFSSLLPNDFMINENGKKEIAKFMEYAVNRCSRAEIKAKENVLNIKASNVSIISQNAVNSMAQLQSVCKSKGFLQIRMAKAVPELVCQGIDFEKPIRCEFESGVSESLGQASGIRIMLDDTLGIYVNTAELSHLESETEVFAVEFTKNEDDYSIVFTDKTNEIIDNISVPVWFIVPATGDYSSVIASYDGGTESRGGQFDKRYKTIEFSATRSGNYQVVEEDITINDIDSAAFSANQAIRFLVSKGILEVDRSNNFYPDAKMTRYDFTKALVSMFYATDDDAACSYSDVPEKSRYYPYVATAEKMEIAKPLQDTKFMGDDAVTNEYMLLICGKVLAEKKGYKFPDNYVEYLSFSDKTEISAAAMPYIAVAVQCGLYENKGEFNPQNPVTREKGAQVLYKTFTLLYDTSPVTTSFSAVVDDKENVRTLNDLTPVERGIICVLITGLLVAGFWILTKKRKPYEDE